MSTFRSHARSGFSTNATAEGTCEWSKLPSALAGHGQKVIHDCLALETLMARQMTDCRVRCRTKDTADAADARAIRIRGLLLLRHVAVCPRSTHLSLIRFFIRKYPRHLR